MRRRELIAMAGVASLASPLVALAQPRDRDPNLAILTHIAPVDRTTGKRERYWMAFFDELRRLGYEEGRNLAVAWHSSQVDAEHAADLARTVVASKPDAIFTPDGRMGLLLKTAVAPIPVVALTVDPVGTGIAASLSRPGGKVTGFSTEAGLEIIGKRLELFRQAVPTASRIAWLTPRRTIDLPTGKTTRESFRTAGMTLVEAVLEAPVDDDAFRRAFEFMTSVGVDSIWVVSTGEMLEHRR